MGCLPTFDISIDPIEFSLSKHTERFKEDTGNDLSHPVYTPHPLFFLNRI